MPKKPTFHAFSPFSGEEYTRQSLRPYTHAVICHVPAEDLIARVERSIVVLTEHLLEAREIEQHYRNETVPQPGSILLKPAQGRSLQQQRAGVKTRWDLALWYRENGLTNFDAAWYANSARSYEDHIARDRATIEEIRATGRYAEGATFHQSRTLAEKALNTQRGYHARDAHVRFEIVEAKL